VSAAYGGFNRIDFLQNGEISVVPITLSRDKINELNSHLMLFYTGIKRTSSDVQQKFVHDMEDKKRQLRIMRDLVDESISILNGNQDIIAFGDLLREAWDIKRSFSKSVSNPEVDAMYDAARSAGAVGGKVTGAGGGGFLLLFVPPEKQERVRQALSKLLYVPFKFEFSGSQVVYASADADYIDVEQVRATQKLQAFKENTEIILSESDPDYRSLKQELPTEEVDRISEKVRGILTGSEKASVAEQK
jgi:D-glycero-alpha-D-manno-heptose-7-phosphate kinase